MRTNFTSDTYSKGQRERAPGKSPSCRFYSCSKSPLSRGPAREIRTGKGVEGALGPLNVLFVFLLFFFFALPLLCLLPRSPPLIAGTDLCLDQ